MEYVLKVGTVEETIGIRMYMKLNLKITRLGTRKIQYILFINIICFMHIMNIQMHDVFKVKIIILHL